MRWIMMLAAALVLPGCTGRQLQSSTAKQARTVVDLEYQQILDNLAMFSLNRDAMPSMAMLKTGATQVGDTGQIGFVGTAGLGTRFGSSPTFSGTRTIVDQWGSSPMTDDNNLMLVRKAFRCALGYKDLLEEEEANDLAHDLSAQIGTTSDMSVDQDSLGRVIGQSLSGVVAAQLTKVDDLQKKPTPELINPPGYWPEGAREENFRRWLASVAEREVARKQLFKIAERLADARETIGLNISDTLDHEILAKSYSLDFRRKIKVLLVSEVGDFFSKNPRENKTVLLFQPDGEAIVYNYHNGNIANSFPLENRLVVAENNKVYQVFLFDDKGKKVLMRTIDQSCSGYIAFEKSLKYVIPGFGDVSPDTNREIIDAAVNASGLKGFLKERFEPLRESATGLAKETIYRINDAQKNLDEINPGWFRCGLKRPKDACYSGHATFCGQECYVWVCRDGLNELEEFTRKVLKLGTTLKDVQVVTAPSGIQFAPALTNPGR